MPDLGSTLSLNTSSFGAGIAAARAKLTELNTSLIENRNKMKEVSKEASELQKQEKALAEAMKDGGTKEQQEEMQKLRDRIGQVNAELGTLKTREREIQSDIRKATNELDNQKNGMNNLANAGDGVANSLKKIETGLKSVFAMAASKKLVDFFIGSNAEMEQYTTSFEVMLKDAEKAQNLMGKLTDLAAVTPMELTDVVPIGTLLMNYGVAADELIDKMTQLGNLSSGNAVKFERISLAYGQMLAKGKVTGEELRQMTEAGVPLLQVLADTLGVTTAEVQDMISKSQVGIDVLDRTIASLTTGTGQFAGMMEKQSQTFSGMLSTLKDNIAQFGRDAGEKTFDVVKDSLSDLMDKIEEWRNNGKLDEIAKGLGVSLEFLVNTIKSVTVFLLENKEAVASVVTGFIAYRKAIAISDIIDKFKKSTEGATVAQKLLNAAMNMNPAALIAGGVAALAVGLVAFEINASNSAERAKELAENIKNIGESAKSTAKEQAQLEDIIGKYEEISNSVDDNINKKDELAKLQERLNALYGDEKTGVDLVNGSYEEQIQLLTNLNEAERARRINQVTNELEEAKKKAQSQVEVSILGTASFDNISDDLKGIINSVIDETRKDFDFSQYFDGWNFIGTEEDMKIVLEQQIKEYEALQTAILNTGEANGAYAETYNAVYDKLELLHAIQDGIISGEEALAILNGEVSVSFDEVENSVTNTTEKTVDLATAFEEASKKIDETADKSNVLKTAIEKLNNDNALTYEEIKKIIDISPDLLNKIQARADGYYIEADALKDLNSSVIEEAKAEIKAEKEKTETVIRETQARLSARRAEIVSFAQSAKNTPEERAELQRRMQAITEAENELKAANKMMTDLDLAEMRLNNLGSYEGKKESKSGKKKEDNTPTLKSISSGAKTVSSAFAEMKKNGELSLATVQSVIDAGYESALKYDEATGKWTISAKAYETAANKQIEEAKKAEGVTKTQCSALDSLKGILDEVTAGTYGAAKATEKLKDVSASSTTKNMKNLAEAVAEQKKNGSLSADTVSELADTDYSAALTIGVDGKITLNTKELEDTLTKEIDDAISQLEKKLATVTGKEAKAIEAQINVFKQLKNSISDVSSGTYGVKEKVVSDEQMKAVEDSANRRLKLIDAELKAKQKLRDETLKAIDDEVQARKRLTEDNDIQRQIDQVMAQLKYSQLDEFSRAQLERKLQSLNNDKADMLWERGIEDRKAAANEQFDAESERLNAEKDAINNSLEVLNKLNDTFVSSISDLGETIKAAMEAVKPDSTINITLNDTDKMTAEQLFAFIEDKYGSTSAI